MRDICCSEENLIMHYNIQADKAVIRSVRPGFIQQCLEGMGLEFSKYNQFKACQQRQRNLNTPHKIEEL